MSRRLGGPSRHCDVNSLLTNTQALVDELATLRARNTFLETRHDIIQALGATLQESNTELEEEVARLQQELDATRRTLQASTAVKKREEKSAWVTGSSTYKEIEEELKDATYRETDDSSPFDNLDDFDMKLFLNSGLLRDRLAANETSWPPSSFDSYNILMKLSYGIWLARNIVSADFCNSNDPAWISASYFDQQPSICCPSVDKCLHLEYVDSDGINDQPSIVCGNISDVYLVKDDGTWVYCGVHQCVGVSYLRYRDLWFLQQQWPHFVANIMPDITSALPDRDSQNPEHLEEIVLTDSERCVVACCGLVKIGYNVNVERALRARSQESGANALKRETAAKKSRSRKKQKRSSTHHKGRT
ncbi:uncharacterized protein B0H18DRAFT_1047662 [Fomitopsis serialis]|uniref:uncharacterized protein n=1 Tax=Fomitopsis serialis TaxID=139415 RepID=UPI002008E9CE|nr:uncharacterized protein B0H18DRAFT_1047662 [Neoantrodia serialis]KAH9913769.1 hypothetical protein B0H18DRAFT_1047662 [Neoantrodia serialis]